LRDPLCYNGRAMNDKSESLTIVVIGASGDLACRKIFPALFALYCQGFLPERFSIFGFARSAYSNEAFRRKLAEHLTCRYVPGESCADRMAEFEARCFYVSGQYASSGSFLDLYEAMQRVEGGEPANRIFYLAIPPSIFVDVARAIGDAGLVSCGAGAQPLSRAVIEKPFGKDSQSSAVLTRQLAEVFTEDQTYRIDHYLGKEVIQNLLVLRFANLVFEPVWNRKYISNIQIGWQEDIGVGGRGGYFDEYGIIRDVIQNHLLQMMALVAMEPPAVLDGKHIRDGKVDVLRNVQPLTMDDLVIGQYTGAVHNGRKMPGYVEDPTVPEDSRTPTFAAAALRIDNPRWQGVPFLIRAGKGLSGRMTEIRILFKPVPGNMFCSAGTCPAPNEMVIRVQPDETIYLTVANKVPGVDFSVESRNLDIRYKAAFSQLIPDAYEDLLLDVVRGEKGLFIRSDELEAAWSIFTPVLHAIDETGMSPELYPFGSRGTHGADDLAARYGVGWR